MAEGGGRTKTLANKLGRHSDEMATMRVTPTMGGTADIGGIAGASLDLNRSIQGCDSTGMDDTHRGAQALTNEAAGRKHVRVCSDTGAVRHPS